MVIFSYSARHQLQTGGSGENEDADLFKNPKMLDRLKAIISFLKMKKNINITIDALIRDFNAKKAYA